MLREGDWHADLVAGLVNARGGTYVEIGVRSGTTYNRAAPHATEAHAVDIDRQPQVHAVGTFWQMPSDQFFTEWQGMADVVFIDGDHSYEQAARDFDNALDRLKPDGVIVLHDTWPATPDDPGTTGTVWQLAQELEQDPGLETFTVPVWPGVTLVQRSRPVRFSCTS